MGCCRERVAVRSTAVAPDGGGRSASSRRSGPPCERMVLDPPMATPWAGSIGRPPGRR
ncbi:hypothetical protein ACFFX0_02345 [Citricoccus parietis]|uniref:Uncharacterized protein n=1 Tax=Citricoccus parietis TaxID=592307 RepID=A0ABV5FUZ3_9MICC